jgi:adenylate cyclase
VNGAIAWLAGPRQAPWREAACALGATLLVAAVYLVAPSPARRADWWTYDVFLRSLGGPAAPSRVVVVDVDERSLAEFGQWPWPRPRVAALVERLRGLGAVAIGLDMFFPEPDRTAPEFVAPARQAPPAAPDGLTSHDAVLAQALATSPVILGFHFRFDGPDSSPGACALHPLTVAFLDRPGASPGPRDLFRASGVTCSLPGLAAAAPASGFLNAIPDEDGVLRRMPIVIEEGGRLYPGLGLAAAMRVRPGAREVVVVSTASGVEAIRLGDRSVPVDAHGNLLLHYRGSGRSFRYVSAADVLTGRLPAGALAGQVVLVGTSAAGLRESVTTPFETVMPGVEVHATVADAVDQGRFLRRPGWAPAIELGSVLAAGAAAAVVLAGTGPRLGPALVALLALGVWGAAVAAFRGAATFLSPVFPLVGLGASAVAWVTVGLVEERRRTGRAEDDLENAQRLMLHSLTALAEVRDEETGKHLLRTQMYARTLARSVAALPRFRRALPEPMIELVASLAPLHDIGKVGVPDRFLRKPGPLDADEYREMRRHPEYGRDVITRAQARAGIRSDRLLALAQDIVYSHHERWDGSGYPEGLRGDAIPLVGRIVAVVDVYDALRSRRVYKAPLGHEEVVEFIRVRRGTEFDPDVIDAFLRVEAEWRRIAIEMAEEDEEPAPPAPAGP